MARKGLSKISRGGICTKGRLQTEHTALQPQEDFLVVSSGEVNDPTDLSPAAIGEI